MPVKAADLEVRKPRRIKGIRIVNKTGHPRDTKVYDPDSGNEIVGVYSVETYNDIKGLKAVLHIRAEMDVVVNDVETVERPRTMHKPLMTVADPPRLTLVIDRDKTDRIVDWYLDDGVPIAWGELTDIETDQIRARLKDEACSPWNVQHRGTRVSDALLALIEEAR